MSETEKKTRTTINQLLSPVMALIAEAMNPYNEETERKRLTHLVSSGAIEVPEDSTVEAEVEKMISRQKAKRANKAFSPTPEQIAFVGKTVRDFFPKEERQRVSLKYALFPVSEGTDEEIFAVVRNYTEDQKRKQIEAASKVAAATK